MSQQRRRRLIVVRRKGIGLVLVMAISMIAGMTDAIGLLMAGDFVSFMSGNTTRAALALGEGDWSTFGILIGAVGCFILGNAFGVVVASRFRKRLAGLLIVVAALLCVAAVLPMGMRGSSAFFVVVLAMGMINATVEHIEGLPIGLTYVTGALSRFGRGIGRWMTGDRRRDWIIQIVPWVGMVAGAVIGGLLTFEIGQQALWFVAGSTAIIAAFALWVPSRLQTRFLSPSGSPVPKRK
ncbi:YoaK family protein [Thalassospira australica]|uniref:YoaK family protein n=1 Tax=Thalassospira australica TaxID=1528106 RepID=UPI00051A2EAC|nr:YoaK family protein [Thalassospira australica]